MNNISAIIITQNEERNIARCLRSLQGIADEVVVVDSGSTDGTEQLCRAAGCRFERHDWEGYAEQKNYANSLATHPWILSIDADEALSPELAESLLTFKQQPDGGSNAYSMNRLTYFRDHAIRHCGWYPERKIRLFRKGAARWDGIVHEELLFEGKATPLRGDLLHYPYSGADDLKAKYTKYATLMGEKYYAQGHRVTALGSLLHPLWTFVRNYLFRLGFLDGADGWTICRLMAHYTSMKYKTLHKLQHSQHA